MAIILVRLIEVSSNMSIRKSRNIIMHVNGKKYKSIWSCCAIRKETEKKGETWNRNLGIYYRSSAQLSSLSPINTQKCVQAPGSFISFPSPGVMCSEWLLKWAGRFHSLHSLSTPHLWPFDDMSPLAFLPTPVMGGWNKPKPAGREGNKAYLQKL